MTTLRVALAQIRLTVGDLAGNAAAVTRYASAAREAGADLVAFPEMTLTGYPPEDLVLRPSFQQASLAALQALASTLRGAGGGELPVAVGYLGLDPAGQPQNAVAWLHRGQVVAPYAKHHLPNYGVFDEHRYFSRGLVLPVARIGGARVALTICEDLWQDGGPLCVAATAGVELVITINGSPYERGKGGFREQLVGHSARRAGVAVAYVNQVGGQDELVFDGGSLVATADGVIVARAAQFDEELLVTDVALPARDTAGSGGATSPPDLSVRHDAGDGTVMTTYLVHLTDSPGARPAAPGRLAEPLPALAELWRALVTATGDYVTKNGFTSVVLGLSGGIDSAVTATIAVDALGGEHVHTVALPSRFSSEHSLTDAEDLASRQQTVHTVVPIEAVVSAYRAVTPLTGLALENLQARVRGTLLMALSNQHGHLVLTTGNKSELATGFSTLYGDSAGGFAPLKDVSKTVVWELARWRNEQAATAGARAPIPQRSITKPPSAELAPAQLDADRLPSYELLDALLDGYVERDRGYQELVAAGFDPEVVAATARLVDLAEYKRRQNPPGPKVTGKAFGRDRRLPITSRWREQATPPVPGVQR